MVKKGIKLTDNRISQFESTLIEMSRILEKKFGEKIQFGDVAICTKTSKGNLPFTLMEQGFKLYYDGKRGEIFNHQGIEVDSRAMPKATYILPHTAEMAKTLDIYTNNN